MSAEATLAQKRILLVENDFYLATDAARALRNAGAEIVGPFSREALALAAIDRRLDAAVVDINLGAGPSFATAAALRKASVPFLFLTGYDHNTIPAEFADIPRFEKPAELCDIVRAVAVLVRD